MADLFVTSHTPTLGLGRALRVYAIVKALAMLGTVDVLYVRFGAEEPSPEYLGDANIRLHAVDSSRGFGRARAVASSRLAGTPSSLARVASPELVARAAALAPRPGEGRIIADGTGTRMALRRLERRHPVILNSHNLESAFQEQLGDEALGSVKQLTRFERQIFGRSSETWMVSHSDVAGARALAPGAAVRYVPNVVDVSAITPAAAPARSLTALLVADFSWPPNRQAVAFLLGEVMPQVWEQLPEARLRLVGRGLDLGTQPVDPRVDIRGFVEDLETEYEQAACVLVPLLSGGGSPLKFVEGLAHGIPVVATPLAAQGLELEPGRDYVQAAVGPGYAEALVEVLRDGADEIGAAGRRVSEKLYSIETLAELLRPGAPL